MYTTYVKNYNVSIAKLNELAKYNQEFNKFLKDTISTFTGEFKLCGKFIFFQFLKKKLTTKFF